ncbi:MAG: hypothetical protein Q6M04_10565, partial [Thermostichus sp. BF3_bins_97]
HVERVLVAHVDHAGADLDPAGPRADGRQQREGGGELAGEVVEDGVDPRSDVQAVLDRYVSITPLQPDLTARNAFDSLQQWGLSAFGS